MATKTSKNEQPAAAPWAFLPAPQALTSLVDSMTLFEKRFGYYAIHVSDDYENEHHVSFDEMDAIDPRLRIAIDAINMKTVSWGEFKANLQQTVNLWRMPTELSYTESNVTFYFADVLTGDLTQNTRTQAGPGLDGVLFLFTEVETCQGVPYTVPQVDVRLLRTSSVEDFTSANTIAPGWKERFMVGASLGLSGRALSDYLFNPDVYAEKSRAPLPEQLSSNELDPLDGF